MLTLDIYLASFITDRIVYKEILKGFTFTQETYLYIMIPLIIASFALAYIIAIIRKKFIKLRQIKIDLTIVWIKSILLYGIKYSLYVEI